MKIYAIDAQSANKKERTGVEQYARLLIQTMKNEPLKEEERVVLYSLDSLDAELGALPSGWQSKILNWPLKRGWMSCRVGWEMFRVKPDVLFVPAQGLPFLFPPLTKGGLGGVVTTIHDIAFIRRPDLYHPSVAARLRRAAKSAVKKATKILVPSQATKNDLMEIYKIADGRIAVTPLAQSLGALPPPLTPPRAGGGSNRSNSFLTIGRLEKKKNIAMLVRAFEIFKSRRGVGDPFELLLAGSPGFGYGEIKKFIGLSPFKNQIRELGYVTDEEAIELMSRATAYVFPSWYEGFGIPNLDAMASGTPLITSDIPVHREVVGDAGLFVPPENPEALARAFERIVMDAALRQELIEKGKRRVAEFSWDKTAKKTWEVMRSLGVDALSKEDKT